MNPSMQVDDQGAKSGSPVVSEEGVLAKSSI